MRVSSPSSSSAPESRRVPVLLAAVGTAALLLLAVVAATGGFTIDLGLFRVSVHRVSGLIAVAVLTWGTAIWYGRRYLHAIASGIATFIERHAAAIAIVIAAASAGFGISYGTYAASGADAGGYVSQAELLAHGQVAFESPLAARVTWPRTELNFSPLGFRPSVRHAEIAPVYPPGLPLVLALSRLAIGEWGYFVAVPLLGFIAVVALYALGARLHSRIAGVIAALLLATSPIFLFQISQPMSDVPAATWWVLAFLAATGGSVTTALLAGLAAGEAVLTRPNLVPLVLAVLACAALRLPDVREPWPSRLRRVVAAGIAMAPAAAALLLLQHRLYGHALESGYGAASAYFSTANIATNIRAYAGRMVEGERPALLTAALSAVALLLFAIAGSARLKTNRTIEAADPTSARVRTAVIVGVAVFAMVVCCYLAYGAFNEWYYLRFLLPGLPELFVAIAAVAAAALLRVPTGFRGFALVALLAAVGLFNVREAVVQQALEVRRSEGRAQLAGRYLEGSLPPNAVIFAFQESASARYYTHRPVIRWDLLTVDLDTAIRDMRALGCHPVLLIEDFEARIIAERFPSSAAARLDWQPRAEVPYPTIVRVYDPDDRGDTTRKVTDIITGP